MFQHMTVFCARRISAIPVLQALLIAHSAWVQIAMLLINVSVSTHPSMTLSTSVIHLATVANHVQIHYALTVPLVL
jgi:hypothetical protein